MKNRFPGWFIWTAGTFMSLSTVIIAEIGGYLPTPTVMLKTFSTQPSVLIATPIRTPAAPPTPESEINEEHLRETEAQQADELATVLNDEAHQDAVYAENELNPGIKVGQGGSEEDPAERDRRGRDAAAAADHWRREASEAEANAALWHKEVLQTEAARRNETHRAKPEAPAPSAPAAAPPAQLPIATYGRSSLASLVPLEAFSSDGEKTVGTDAT